jgi:uncharacterized protein with FMN-binding domain
MPKNRPPQSYDPIRTLKKLLLSSVVLLSFAMYAAYERLTKPVSALSQNQQGASANSVAAGPFGSLSIPALQPATGSSQSNAGSVSTSYKDGTYQGPPIDAYYGLVQVEVTIQNGAIQNVQFLQYPNDRRTSQEINSIAMPYLQQEAVQAQSAQVDIISGATLTSEGFIMSLQSALQAAHPG